jgi:two-component system, LytTR family, response regulator LytT
VHILIVEDELLIAEMLKEMLQDLGHTVAAICDHYNEVEQLFSTQPTIDFAFLDINLNAEKSGLDIAEYLRTVHAVKFAFLTSYSDKTTITNAMVQMPDAYLIKPFSEPDLFATLELAKVKQSLNKIKPVEEAIVIKDGTTSVKLLVDDIWWIKSDNIYVEVKTSTKIYLLRSSLVNFLDTYALPNFARTHRTFAVNVNHVSALTGQYAIVKGEKIPISRKHKDEVIALFN